MFRLTVFLCAAIFGTLLIAGQDKGQLRPGLAAAVASGQEIVVLERRRAPAEPVAVAEPEVAVAGAAPVVQAVTEVAESHTPAAAPAEAAPAPVFTLSALPTATMDSPGDSPADSPAGPEAEPAAAAPAPAPASGDIWYVTATTVNVRQDPSTSAPVVEKLVYGEAVAVSFDPGSEWAHVRVEGDGLEGYVALRFLSPDAP